MKRCLYCYELKNESEFSKEHVIPRSLGGNFNVSNNPFLIYNVCERCNNVLGVHVDAPFTKSVFMKMYEEKVSNKWLNLKENEIKPLIYMGYNQQLIYKDYICESYLGPTGDTVYHFHKQYPGQDKMTGMVGVPPTAKNKKPDTGFVFLFLVSNNPEWWPTIFSSVIKPFKNAVFYLGNGPTPNIVNANFKDIPKELKDLHTKLWEIQNSSHEQKLSFDIYAEQRFMTKLALSIGAAFLNENFITSNDASILRKFMREKDPEKRKKIPVKGKGMLNHNWETVKGLINWEYGHILLLKPINKDLIMFVGFYGEFNSSILISSNKSHWQDKISEQGLLYVLIPKRQNFIGPMNLTRFLLHKHKLEPHKELIDIENELKDYKRPPIIIDDKNI